ncbi:MAG: hypothetical protein P4L79_01270 [Legionella sp.]|uniref:hypothetical protein n=1 Tax=Legionella sp. TaxID=459 RepID=UPI002847C16D|nr:hypothetical protein [Legionella sp.]
MLELKQLLIYKNAHVLVRYERDFPHNRLNAEEALGELIKFFWLCYQHNQDKLNSANSSLDFTCMMHAEMHELDDMWHTFLLFTKEYQEFCQTNFGYFIHHSPLIEEDKLLANAQYNVELERFLSYIYDHLGEETVSKWFHDCL